MQDGYDDGDDDYIIDVEVARSIMWKLSSLIKFTIIQILNRKNDLDDDCYSQQNLNDDR